MKAHGEINRLLAAYCGGDLSDTERQSVEEHLVSCAVCRADLAALKATLRLMRSSPEVEPPPWLSVRIMNRIKEEQAMKTGWLQRFFFPLHIKLPLEALALLMVCVTGYYLSRSVETDLGRPVPQADSPLELPPPQKTAPSVKREQSTVPRPEPAAPPGIPHKAAEEALPPPAAAPAAPPDSLPPAPAPSKYAPAPPAFKAERSAPSSGEELEAKGVSPAAQSEDRRQESPRKMQKAAPRTARQESATMAPAPAGRADSAGAPAAIIHRQGLVRLRLGDSAAAAEAVRQAVSRSGGAVVAGEQPAAQRILQVRIPAARYSELMERLGRLGRIVEQPAPPSPAGVAELVIEW